MSFFRKLSESVSKGVTTATEKAQQTVEVTKLSVQIAGKRKEINRLFAIMGESVYEAYLSQDLSHAHPMVEPDCARISEIRAEIAELDNRIKMLRSEKDCTCGKRVSYDSRFCPSCGYEFNLQKTDVSDYEEDEVLSQAERNQEIRMDSGLTGASRETHSDSLLAWNEIASGETESARIDERKVCASCETPLYADSHFCPACGQTTR